jgi:predicted DNA-binding protein
MMPPPNDRQVIVRMPVSMRDELERQAEHYRTTVSQLVRDAVGWYLDVEEDEQ